MYACFAHTEATCDAPRPSMASVPRPDYDDFFRDLSRLEREHKVRISCGILPVEASRGCWWGQKQHCVFCGIDEATLRYRQMQPSQVLGMLDDLSQRYEVDSFRFVDYILPFSYYETLLGELEERHAPYSLTCEIKANIKPSIFRRLRAAGFTEMQPGIESFSTSILSKMQKGVSAIRNILTLKLAVMHDVVLHYNILFGLPSDTCEEYEKLLEVVPLLYHLRPPFSDVLVAVTRFAPLQTDPERFRIAKSGHARPYDLILSRDYLRQHDIDLDDLAYYFGPGFEYPPELTRLYSLLKVQVAYWRRVHSERQVELSSELGPDSLVTIYDSRYTDVPRVRTLSEVAGRIYGVAPSGLFSMRELTEMLRGTSTPDEVSQAVSELEQDRLVYREGELVVCLAVPRDCRKNTSTKRSSSWGFKFDKMNPVR